MTDHIALDLPDLLFLLFASLGLVAVVVGAQALARRAPAGQVGTLLRLVLLPVVELAVAAGFAALVVQRLFAGAPAFGAAAMVGVLLLSLWLARDPIRDAMAGMILRGGGSLRTGDHLRVDGVEGRVKRLGVRSVLLELPGGDESRLPWGRLSDTVVVRRPQRFGAHPHSFRLPAGTEPERVIRAGLLCHWSSLSRPPSVAAGSEGLLVTVFSVDPARGPSIEAFVRRQLG